MTFDEVVEIIWGNTLGVDASDEPGKKDFIIKDDMVATGREALTFLIKELKKTYAPTIEMTQLQYNDLKYYLKNYPLDKFIYDFGKIYDTELSEKDLAQAWLHPEAIKVVDNDI